MDVSSVLIISYHSSLNNGDRALLETNIRQLRLAFGNPKIQVTTQWPNESYFKQAVGFEPLPSVWRLIGLSAENRAVVEILKYLRAEFFARAYQLGARGVIPAAWLRLFDAYKKTDLIVSVSSTHFYSTGRFGWPFPVKIFMANLAHYFKKPLIIMPQSIGPLRWNWEKRMLRSTFSQARLVLLRDQVSIRLAEEICLPKEKVRFAPDPAFAYPPADSKAALTILNRYGFNPSEPALGMTLIPRHGRAVNQHMMTQYFQGVARFLESFHQETGARIFLFNQVTGPTIFDDDHQATEKLMEQLKGQPWMTYVDEIIPADLLKACYGKMDLFLATRMHSGIFALDMGVPTVFIGYGTKTRGMMQWLGLEKWVVDIEKVSQEALLKVVLEAWRERQGYHEMLVTKMPEATRQVLETAELIRTYYAANQP